MLSQETLDLVARMFKGDRASLARLISMIERESPEVPEIMGLVNSHSQKSFRIGVTGLAGAGKSTLIDKLVTLYRKNGSIVGVIAVDPSSPVTGGAVLGDRIRMQQHYLDRDVFIRSMATRGSYGGLCKAIDNTVKLIEAYHRDILFIETTGVGQTETDISRLADTVVLILIPGFGDSIQLMKAGLIEIADIVVINKADREGAEILANQVRDELRYSSKNKEQSVLLTEAINDIGIEDLYQEIEKRRDDNNQPDMI